MRIVAMTVAALALAGCGHKDAGTTATGGDGAAPAQAAASGGSWPAGVAAIAPAYPGATIGESASLLNGTVQTVTFTTPDSMEKVATFYKDVANRAGMTPGADLPSSTRRMLTAEKPGGASITVTMNTEGGVTHAKLMVGTGQ